MKFNYKKDGYLGFIGALIMYSSSVYSFTNDEKNKGIVLIILGSIMLGFGIFCSVKAHFSKPKNDKKQS